VESSPFGFQVAEFVFEASSQSERDTWMTKIKEVRNNALIVDILKKYIPASKWTAWSDDFRKSKSNEEP
jgi:hypothetical protein